MSSDILRDSLRRFLDRHWSIRESAQAVRSASVMRPLWSELCELGFSQLGAQETGGLLESLPILQDLGAANCTVPLPEAIVINAALRGSEAPWLAQVHSGEVVPALSVEAPRLVADLDAANPLRCTIRGTVDLVDAVAATHIAIVIRAAQGQAPLPGWI